MPVSNKADTAPTTDELASEMREEEEEDLTALTLPGEALALGVTSASNVVAKTRVGLGEQRVSRGLKSAERRTRAD